MHREVSIVGTVLDQEHAQRLLGRTRTLRDRHRTDFTPKAAGFANWKLWRSLRATCYASLRAPDYARDLQSLLSGQPQKLKSGTDVGGVPHDGDGVERKVVQPEINGDSISGV